MQSLRTRNDHLRHPQLEPHACITGERSRASATGKAVGRNSSEFAAESERLLKLLTDRIKGRENDAADQVFKNVQIAWLKTVPAGLFLRIMNGGYSRALGVSCTHCHVEEDFSSDDKRQKRAAREMARMHRMINQQLEKMENLEAAASERSINCATCHRGAVSPLAADR